MSLELLRLGPSEGAAEAAADLARTRHVQLDPGPSGAAPPAPFLRGPAAIAFWTSTEAEPPPAVERRLGAIDELGLELGLYDVASFGPDRLVEEIYFPLFVRLSYCTGAAPFQLNLDNFRRLADPRALLAVASAQGSVLAAALLRPAVPGDAQHVAAPAPVDRCDVIELVATGVEPFLPDADDLFFFAVLQMLAAHEHGWVWVRERPWVTPRRAARWTASARRATHVAFQPSHRDWYAWNPGLLEDGEGVLFLESSDAGSALVCHVHGRDPDMFAEARRALASRGVRVP